MDISEKVVYLDNAATTACAPEVLAVMVEALSGACGNPSSHYSVGYEAKEFVDKYYRDQLNVELEKMREDFFV